MESARLNASLPLVSTTKETVIQVCVERAVTLTCREMASVSLSATQRLACGMCRTATVPPGAELLWSGTNTVMRSAILRRVSGTYRTVGVLQGASTQTWDNARQSV